MNLLDLLMQRGFRLRKAGSTHGGEYQGLCPWCGGEDRFHVWPQQQETDSKGRPVACSGRYWCRPGIGHCGRSGDAIQFLIDYEHLSFQEACGRLGQKYDPIEARRYPKAPAAEGAAPWDPTERPAPAGTWAEHAAKFIFWASERLFETPEALAYLAGRGIREETALRFWLGWNPGRPRKDGTHGPYYKNREAWGLSPEMNEKTGKPRAIMLPVGWVIPHIEDGVVARIRVRQVDGAEPRYYMIKGSSSATMVIEPERPGHRNVYVIVEAELDAILISQEAGDLVGAIALGSASTRPDRAAAEKLDRAGHILNALDADGAGAKESGKWWAEHYPEAVRWPVPEGKDPGEAWQKGVNLREWIVEGLPEGLRKGQRHRGTEAQRGKG